VTVAQTADETVCEVRDVTLERTWPGGEQVTIFEDVSFSAKRASITCIQGRSGSGKSSLLHIIAGMLPPTSGCVRLSDVDVWTLREEERAKLRRDRLSLVLQDGGLIDSLTVIENVLLAQPDGDRQDAMVALDSVGVAQRARAMPRQLSMGERHRVALARALLGAPRLLLLDEPTASLDRGSAEIIVQLLQRLRDEQDLTMVVATHDPAVIQIGNLGVALT
jgi:putative ABC transport system ATP-binding protein